MAGVGWGVIGLWMVSSVLAQPREGGWAHDASSALEPSPDVIWGSLDNGFRYALLPHEGVPGAATLQFLVLSGSLEERDDERGIAHFIEHMCFRGTSEFTEEEMVRFFQELGTEYGSDVNAVTSFDHTAYTLDFRDASPELLSKGLRLFRNFADGVTFDPQSIEDERGVIRSELRGRDGLAARGQMASTQVMFDGLRFPHRSPGGTPESINALTAAQFREFYNRHYRSDLMILVAAGDFDPANLAALVREQFASMVKPTSPVPEREIGQLSVSRGMRAGTFRVSDVGYARSQVAWVRDQRSVPDRRESRLESQRQTFAQTLLSDRLGAMLMNTPGGGATLETLLGYHAAIAGVAGGADNWESPLVALDQMIRSTLEHGFEQQEVDALRKRQLRMAEHMVAQYEHLDPHTLSQDLLDSILENKVYVGWQREFAWTRDWLNSTTPEELHASFREAWDPDHVVFHLSGDIDPALKPADVLEEVEKGRKRRVRRVRPGARKEYSFDLQEWGTPTDAELVRQVPELGVSLYQFGNQVRLNVASMPYEPGIVRAVVRVGSGLLDMPGSEPALKEFGLQTLFASGTAHYRAEDLNRIIGDQFLEFDFNVDDYDAFTFRGVTGQEELTSFLGVVTEFLQEPQFGTYVHRSEKIKAAMSRASNSMGMQEGMRELTDYLFKGDPRFTWGTMVDYIGMSSVDVRRWLEEPLRNGFVEVTIVGDVAEEDAVAAVRRTLGQLDSRAESKTLTRTPKPVEVTAPAGFKRIEFVGERHLAAVTGIWPVTEALSTRDRAALYILSKLLELHIREEIRNNLGLAYGPSASFENYDGFPEFGVLRAMIDCSSSETTRIARLVEDIAQTLSLEGVDEGEFIGARGILSSRIRRAWMDNAFVIKELARVQERPESLEELIALRAGLVDEITIDEVNAWAKKILTRRNSRTAAIVPKQFIGIFQTD